MSHGSVVRIHPARKNISLSIDAAGLVIHNWHMDGRVLTSCRRPCHGSSRTERPGAEAPCGKGARRWNAVTITSATMQ